MVRTGSLLAFSNNISSSQSEQNNNVKPELWLWKDSSGIEAWDLGEEVMDIISCKMLSIYM